jgi:hypothetical protein
MNTTGLNLVISDKADVERDTVARAFENHGGIVHRIGRFWDPPPFEPATVRVYGAVSFCLVLQQKLGLTLCSPGDELIFSVPGRFLNRRIARRTLAEIPAMSFPAFVKPVAPKLFRAAVYQAHEEITTECRGLSAETAVLVSEPVTFTAEVRAFVLDRAVLDAGVYEGTCEVAAAAEFVAALTESISLPRTVVIDVGFIEGRGWAVIEFNAAWGAGLNGCDAEKVLPAIVSGTGD